MTCLRSGARRFSLAVIPAEAGIQRPAPFFDLSSSRRPGMPAYAGMTAWIARRRLRPSWLREGLVRNKAVALALNPDGEEVLGLWTEQSEGAKFRLKAVNELKARGVNDILIAVVDGLKGFSEAIGSVYPATVVQPCIVHLIRNSLAFVSWTDRKAILPAIKAIYRADNADMAVARLEEFEIEWGKRYPATGQIWRRAWEQVARSSRSPPSFAR